TFSGHPDRALAALERIEGTDQRIRVVRAIAAAPALALTGRTADAVKVAEAGYADHLALGDELAIAHPAMHLVNQVFALADARRVWGERGSAGGAGGRGPAPRGGGPWRAERPPPPGGPPPPISPPPRAGGGPPPPGAGGPPPAATTPRRPDWPRRTASPAPGV